MPARAASASPAPISMCAGGNAILSSLWLRAGALLHRDEPATRNPLPTDPGEGFSLLLGPGMRSRPGRSAQAQLQVALFSVQKQWYGGQVVFVQLVNRVAIW